MTVSAAFLLTGAVFVVVMIVGAVAYLEDDSEAGRLAGWGGLIVSSCSFLLAIWLNVS